MVPALQLHGLAGRYDKPYAGVDFIPQSWIYEFPWKCYNLWELGTELSYRPASLRSLAGRYDNPIPTTRFLAPIYCLMFIKSQHDIERAQDTE